MFILEEWRIDAIERSANHATQRLHEIDTLHSSVDRLESSVQQISSEIDGIRHLVQTLQEENVALHEIINGKGE